MADLGRQFVGATGQRATTALGVRELLAKVVQQIGIVVPSSISTSPARTRWPSTILDFRTTPGTRASTFTRRSSDRTQSPVRCLRPTTATA